MKKIKLKVNQKLVFEFISISFVVFLGLMLNQWKENYNNVKLAEKSIQNIQLEITTNTSKVQKMLDSHKLTLLEVEKNLSQLDTNEELGPSNLGFQLVSSTSWETAKITRAIAYMDIKMVDDVAGVYEFQDYYKFIIKDYVINNLNHKSKVNSRELLENSRDLLKFIIVMETDLLKYYHQIQTKVLVN